MTTLILNGANGKMGKNIIDIVQNDKENFKIAYGVDKNEENSPIKIYKNFNEEIKVDAVIDFSNPSSLDSILSFSKKTKTPLVIATTGYSEEEIEKIKLASKETAIFFTFNMSLGINLLLSLVKKSYQILKDKFDIEIVEKHHNQKIDAPSGTALMLADAINEEANKKFKYVYNRQNIRKKREENEIGIHSIRAGTIVGEHEVIFSGEDETISLSHIATSKRVFAIGSLKAAEFIKTKKVGLFTMKDLIEM